MTPIFWPPILGSFVMSSPMGDPLEETEVQREVMLCMPVPVCWGCPDEVLAETPKDEIFAGTDSFSAWLNGALRDLI